MKNITITLRELNPEAANMWSYDLNGELTPDTVSGKSDITVYFRCLENPKHLFSKKISKMTADDGHSYGCIYCGPNAKKVFPGETDFFTKCPVARSMWDYELNLDIEPTKTFPNSNKYAYFRCEKGHSTYRKIMDFNYSPKCSDCEKEKTKLVYNAPNTRLFWNINKNADVNLDDLAQSSRYNASFSCPNCKYEWPLQVSLWNERRYCPCCGFDGSEGSIEKNHSIIAQNPIITFRMANPEDSEMWRYDKNGDMTPDNSLFGSNKKAYFRCKNGHEFSNYIYRMTTSDGKPKGCPHCNSKKKIIYPGKNDFFSVCPVGKEMWDYNKNSNINPETLSPNSGVKANFKCSEGHEFPRRIQQFTKNPVCPECKITKKHGKTVVKPKITKTFRRINPEASKTWVNELNNGLTPDNVSEKSGKMVYLRCVNNPKHVYPKKICNIPKKEPFGCPYCKEEGKLAISSVINDEIAVCTENMKTRPVIADFPHMVNQWNYPKNIGIDITLTSANSKDSVWWRCKKCNHEWPAQIASRKMSKGLCPCCENRIVIKKGITDLFTMVPDLEKDYDYIKNIDINVDELSVSTKTPIWWKCNECGHKWPAYPASRILVEGENYKIRNCPACAGIVRTKTYAEEYPELIDRFLENRNGCKLADLKGSDLSHYFWWHCDICGEDFETELRSMIRSKDTQNKGCSYCAGKKVTYEKSFAYIHPEVMDEYAPSNIIDPYNVTEYSTKLANWVCRNNKKHKWEATFQSRAQGEGGCNICHKWNYNKMLYEEHPEFESYYDTEKNERPFSSYSNMSNEYVWWNCENGHSFQWSVLNFSRLGRFECPICANKLFVPGENDLESQYPDLAAEFDVEKNGIGPDMIAFTNSNEDIWWKCDQGHEFQRSVWYRLNRVRECPICNRTIVAKGINDFQSAYPDVIKIWDYESNEKKPDEISDKNNSKFAFKCEHGHHYEALLGTELANDFECMVCSGKIVQEGVNSLIDTHPDLAKEFSPNEERKPNEFTKSFAYTIKWKCPTCGGEYNYPINEREVGDESCPYCHKDRVLAGFNSLKDTHSDLAKEFSPSNERGPETYLKSNKSWVSWQCPTCGGEYSYPINEREVGDESCPYCHKNRALAGFNSLIDTHSDLAKEFSPSNERGPETYHKECTYRAAWLCPTCGGEYSYPINEREVGDDACPYCRGTKVLPGVNSFEHNHPDLMEEWDKINNYLLSDPDAILDNYSKNVWWICNDCKKRYLMSPKRRIYYQKRKKMACTICKGLRRKKKYFF